MHPAAPCTRIRLGALRRNAIISQRSITPLPSIKHLAVSATLVFSSLLHFLSTLQFFLAIYSLTSNHSLAKVLPIMSPFLFNPFFFPARTPSTYSPRPPIYLIFSFLPFLHSSSRCPVGLFCASHFLSSRSAPNPLSPFPSYTRIFFLSTFPPPSTSIPLVLSLLSLSFFTFSLFVILFLSLSLVSRVYAASEKKRPRHGPSRLTFCSLVGHRRY